MTIQELTALAEKIGFEHAGALDPATIELNEEVREMCASGKCAMYDKRWSCPPGCGTLDDCRELLKGYTHGILVVEGCKANGLPYFYGENTIAYTSCFLLK